MPINQDAEEAKTFSHKSYNYNCKHGRKMNENESQKTYNLSCPSNLLHPSDPTSSLLVTNQVPAPNFSDPNSLNKLNLVDANNIFFLTFAVSGTYVTTAYPSCRSG